MTPTCFDASVAQAADCAASKATHDACAANATVEEIVQRGNVKISIWNVCSKLIFLE